MNVLKINKFSGGDILMKNIVMGILAHVDSGKTTLSEALLYCSGTLKKLGRVDHRNSFLDTFSLERERGITIFSKQAVFTYKNTEFTLIDTPGHADFSAETERTLQVLDYALLVISASEGIQSHTMTLWKLLEKYSVPCFIFVNKIDLDNAQIDIVFNDIKDKLSENCIDFSDRKSNTFYENIALCDDKFLDLYEKNNIVEINEISVGIQKRKIFPCMFGSALKLKGIEAFLDMFEQYTLQREYPQNFSGKVFKISEDKQGTRLTHIKVTGGKLQVRDVLQSDKNFNGEKVNQIRVYSGDKFTAKETADAGSICALTGISFAVPGDCLGEEKSDIQPLTEAVLTYNAVLPEGTDAHKMYSLMKNLEAEDPQLHVTWNERYQKIQVRIMGEIQLEILREIIKERFGIYITFGKGNIIYKETITDVVEGIGHFESLRHYAEVHLIIKPGKRNSGIVIRNNCSEDMLDRNWQRLILTHIKEKTHIGVLTGSPITDVEIILESGKAHLKHTEGGDFRQATYRAIRQGLRSSHSILLEPVYEFTLEIPNENVGKAISDIHQMSGRFSPPEIKEGNTVINGIAPVSEMNDYGMEVMRYTHGMGKLMCRIKGYEPCHNTEEVISMFAYNPDSDIENTGDSVFCSHGAGYNVKWNEVKNHMHLPSVLNKINTSDSSQLRKEYFSGLQKSSELFALDKELVRIFEQTYGPIKRKKTNQSINYDYSRKNTEKVSQKPVKRIAGDEYILVDGYNVIFAWDNLRIIAESNFDAARNSLINILCNYQGYKKCEMIVVFDAYKVKGNVQTVEKHNNISVVYTKEAETADMYIEKAVHKLAGKNRVRVVTSDGTEQLIILAGGALRISSSAFYEEVKQAENEIREIISDNNLK